MELDSNSSAEGELTMVDMNEVRKVKQTQRELDSMQDEFNAAVLRLVVDLKRRRSEKEAERAEQIQSLPRFWAGVWQFHKSLAATLGREDVGALECLLDLEVVTPPDPALGFVITMKFDSVKNQLFSDRILWKAFTFNDELGPKVFQSGVHWRGAPPEPPEPPASLPSAPVVRPPLRSGSQQRPSPLPPTPQPPVTESQQMTQQPQPAPLAPSASCGTETDSTPTPPGQGSGHTSPQLTQSVSGPVQGGSSSLPSLLVSIFGVEPFAAPVEDPGEAPSQPPPPAPSVSPKSDSPARRARGGNSPSNSAVSTAGSSPSNGLQSMVVEDAYSFFSFFQTEGIDDYEIALFIKDDIFLNPMPYYEAAIGMDNVE